MIGVHCAMISITLLHHNLSSITGFYLVSMNASSAHCAITVHCLARHSCRFSLVPGPYVTVER